MAHKLMREYLIFLAVCCCANSQGQQPATNANLELERRIKAILAPSSGVFGVSVKHVEHHEGAGVRADEAFQMASVFKIPVLIELFHQVGERKVSLEERVEWKNPELYFGSGVLASLQPGLRPTIHDLATLMIVLSDNAATDTLCDKLGVENITARVRALGLRKTSVDMGTRRLILQALGLGNRRYENLTTKTIREVQWDKIADEVRQNQRRFLDECPNCTTPAEMTLLLEKVLTGQTGSKESTTEMLEILSHQEFNQRLPRWLPLGVRCDHKTGTLQSPVWVVNDAGIIYLPRGEHLIVSVFSHGTELRLSGAEIKAAIGDAEARIGEIGKAVFDYYTVPRTAAVP